VKWLKWYIILIVGLLALYMLAEYNRPRIIDWSKTFSNRDKIPYGTFVLYKELSSLFSGIQATELREPVFDHVNNNENEDELYILINRSVETSKADEAELYKYIERGNTVFISSSDFSESFKKKFNIETNRYADYFDGKDSSNINLSNPALKASKDFSLEKNTLDAHFTEIDTAKASILGVNSYKNINFIRLKIGEGYLFLHTVPVAFTNYFLLKDNNAEYISKVFSYLPAKPSAIFWDEYYKLGRSGPRTPLRVLLTRPALKWAWYTALAGMIIFVIFHAKRRQRIIPVINPPSNDSKEFVETVSRVYLNQKHHKNIAEKKISFWLDFVRSRFNVNTQQLSDDFCVQLAHKSGTSREVIQHITNSILHVRSSYSISATDLITINQQIDHFYKQIK